MAYALHLERDANGIGLNEWKEAVAAVEGVRLCSGEHSITNPVTHEVITVPLRDGDAEVHFPENNNWRPAFHWFKGRISFKAMPLPAGGHDPIWQAATALALHLDARIRGDGGEIYDLKTAKVVKDHRTNTRR